MGYAARPRRAVARIRPRAQAFRDRRFVRAAAIHVATRFFQLRYVQILARLAEESPGGVRASAVPFLCAHEDILVFSRAGTAKNARHRMTYNPQGTVPCHRIEAGKKGRTSHRGEGPRRRITCRQEQLSQERSRVRRKKRASRTRRKTARASRVSRLDVFKRRRFDHGFLYGIGDDWRGGEAARTSILSGSRTTRPSSLSRKVGSHKMSAWSNDPVD